MREPKQEGTELATGPKCHVPLQSLYSKIEDYLDSTVLIYKKILIIR